MGFGDPVFIPNPYDLENVSPSERQDHDRHELLLFHPTRLDWTYSGEDRSSGKANDRLIRAFRRFLDDGHKARLLLLERGADVRATHELVKSLGLAQFTLWESELKKKQLVDYLNAADIVADQFTLGAFGGTALEAMACAKPLLTHLKSSRALECYGDLPPIMNVATEDEIYTALVALRSPAERSKLGRRARAWIEKHHDWRGVTDTLIRLYESTLNGTGS